VTASRAQISLSFTGWFSFPRLRFWLSRC